MLTRARVNPRAKSHKPYQNPSSDLFCYPPTDMDVARILS